MKAIENRLRCAKAYVFDFLGTVVEIDNDAPLMWESLTELGYQGNPELQAVWDSEAFNGCITPSLNSNPSYDMWRRFNLEQLARVSGVPESLIRTVVDTLLDRDLKVTVRAVPRAISLIQFLREHDKKIGLCSNWDYAIQSYLDHSGLPQFDDISVSAEVGVRKPHVRIFADICFKLEVTPSDAVFIGDNWATDIVGALRSGLTPVWIRHGKSSRGFSHAIPEFETMEECEGYLRELLCNNERV